MRIFLYSIAIISLIGSASANRPVSGVVAVSTGPMQAKYTDAAREIGRDLAAGDNVFLNDEVETGRETQAQVMLKDESVFSISPNSKVMFDEFIYDPFAQTGTLSARLLGGGMRFVSGKIANQQPQNVKIKAGTATVGIRGTEIVVKHSQEGSTFVLLSGAMEVSSPAGMQMIDRPGFGLDVSADGLLGNVRRVPTEEINRLLSPPPPAEEDRAADEASSTDENNETSDNEDSETQTAETALESDEAAAETDGEDNSGSETPENSNDRGSEETSESAKSQQPSSFDNAIMFAAQSSDENKQNSASIGLSDITLTLSPSDEMNDTSSTSIADQKEESARKDDGVGQESEPREQEDMASDFELTTEEPGFSNETSTALIIESLVEDKKDERGTSIAEEIAQNSDPASGAGEGGTGEGGTGEGGTGEDLTEPIIEDLTEPIIEDLTEPIITGESGTGEDLTEPIISLSLETAGTLTTDPYFSSDGTLLIRSQAIFETNDDQFGVTHSMLREKFPNSFNGDGIVNHADTDDTARQTSGLDFSGYDAAFVYLRRSEDDEFGSSEMETYRDFIHTDGNKVLIIGRADPTRGHVDPNDPDNPDGMHNMDTALPMYYNGSSGTRYEAGQATSSSDKILTPTNASTSDLLAGVSAFRYNYSTSNNDLAVDIYPLSGSLSADVGILAADGSTAALDLSAKGAVFAGRYACSAYAGNNSDIINSSINANLVNNGREQFCRNLISSIAPEDTLVDVEVGTLSVSGNSEGASYRLVGSDSDSFKIIGDKVILDGNTSLTAGNYDLTIGVTRAGEEEIERTVSVAVENGVAEKRVISTRDTYNVGDTVSFPTENLVSHKAYLEELTKNTDDVSWISFGSSSGGGTPGNTGIITLHYRVTEGDITYDRFHEIEINHECSSDHCAEFATSMDTVSNFTATAHFKPSATVSDVFEANDFTAWSSLFDRFTTGTGRFVSRNYQANWPANADYHYDLEISYGSRAGILEADGTLAGHTLDERWQFNFLQCSGALGSHVCSFTDNNDNFDLNVSLAYMALPNGKHSIVLRNVQNWNGGGTNYGWSPMTPQ